MNDVFDGQLCVWDGGEVGLVHVEDVRHASRRQLLLQVHGALYAAETAGGANQVWPVANPWQTFTASRRKNSEAGGEKFGSSVIFIF